MTIVERFEGCIIGGAIGDALGSAYENKTENNKDIFYLFGRPKIEKPKWQITDDTQLTLATIEAMLQGKSLETKLVAHQFLKYYRQRKLRGIGASTLQALKELDFGGHWSQVGRRGEYGAGNGAAMRIAPIAFIPNLTSSEIRNICFITHHNDEAYIGAKSVVIAIREILSGNWNEKINLLKLIIQQIPDTRVRDRLIEIKDIENLEEIGAKGNDGYVVNSVPLVIAAASKVSQIGLQRMYSTLIKIGGDTDTNCSIAGQIAGTLIGRKEIPQNLINKLKQLYEYNWIKRTISHFTTQIDWTEERHFKTHL